MENKQTAVEWLFKQLWEEPKDKMVWYAILDKAKEMEEMQSIPYQLCPKCNGDGNFLRYNSTLMKTTSSNAICDVCNGSKIILMYKK